MLDFKIINGTVFDGLGGQSIVADIGIAGDRITDVGDLSAADANVTIDATDRYVCPGFIDAHSHSDTYLLIEPDAPSKLFQGITTEVIGNCGASAAPLHGDYRMPSDWKEKDYPSQWSTVSEYRDLLESITPGPNSVLLIGHNTLRAGVMGYDDREATVEEIKQMRSRLEASLEEGGAGLSTGLVYSPGMFAPREEIIALAEVVSDAGKIYTSHMRSESGGLLEAIDETLDIGRKANCRVQVSHLKTSGKANWGLIDGAIERIEKARAEGLDVACDRYPYTASCTDLDVIFPEWASGGGREVVLARLRNPSERARIRDALLKGRDDDYWETIRVGSTHHPDNRPFTGKPLLEVAEALKLDPVDTVLHLTDTDELMTSAFFFTMSEENMWRILALPYCMFGSDASLRATCGQLSHDHPHPRAYGSLTRFIRASLEGRTVSFEDLVRKCTSLTADHFRLKDRGVLAAGKMADVVVLDPGNVREHTDYTNPHQLSTGIDHVIVNGTPTLADGEVTGNRAGRLLS